MSEIIITNGTKKLIGNGVIIIDAKDATTITLNENNEVITLIIKFTNTDDKQTKKHASVLNKTTLEIEFSNYNNALGNYTKEFWRIGQFIGRGLYWSYSIAGLQQGNMKKLEFSFYLGEEVANG